MVWSANCMNPLPRGLVSLVTVLVLFGCKHDGGLQSVLNQLHASGASETEVQAEMTAFDAHDMGLRSGQDAQALLEQFCGAVEAGGLRLLSEHGACRFFSTLYTTIFAFFDDNRRFAGYVVGGQ